MPVPPDLTPIAKEIDALRDRLLRMESAYARFVPRRLLGLLGVESVTELELGHQVERVMTILFSDIRDFTTLSERMTPREVFRFLNSYLLEMEPTVASNGGIVDKFIGDAIMGLFPDSADDAVRAGLDMLAALKRYNEGRARAGYVPVDIGIGLNTGFVIVGTVGGASRMEGTVISDAVNISSRLENLTKTYHVPLLASEHTLYGMRDGEAYAHRFLDRIRVKGKIQPLSVYEIFQADAPELREAKLATLADFEQGAAYCHLRMPELARPLLRRCVEAAPGDIPAAIYLARCDALAAGGPFEGSGEVFGTMAWRDEFTLGYPPIDDEHHKLLEGLNQLALDVEAGDATRLGALLSFLKDYAREHFATEERLMAANDYPLAAQHLLAHRRFEYYLARLDAEIRSGRHEALFLKFRIQLFLMDWFANHSTGTDRHLAKFLMARGASPPAR